MTRTKCQAKNRGESHGSCDYDAAVEIAGKVYCIRHARIEALKIAFDKGYAKPAPSKVNL